MSSADEIPSTWSPTKNLRRANLSGGRFEHSEFAKDGDLLHCNAWSFHSEHETAKRESSMEHIIGAVNFGTGSPASTRKPCNANGPAASSCDRSSFQQSLSEPSRPEGSSSLCGLRRMYFRPTSPSVSELDCAGGASGEATRACDDTSVLSRWTTRPHGHGLATAPELDGRAGKANKHASSKGMRITSSQSPSPSLHSNTEEVAPAMLAVRLRGRERPQTAVTPAAQLDSGYPLWRGARVHAPAGRNPHRPSAAPLVCAVGDAWDEVAGSVELGLLCQGLNLTTAPAAAAAEDRTCGLERRAPGPSAHCSDASGAEADWAAVLDTAAPRDRRAEQHRKRWMLEVSAPIADGLEGPGAALAVAMRHHEQQQERCSRPPCGPSPTKHRRVELRDLLDSPGLWSLAAAADAVLQTPQLCLQTAAAVATEDAAAVLQFLTGLEPGLEPSNGLSGDLSRRLGLGGADGSGGCLTAAATPHETRMHDPAADARRQLSWGRHQEGDDGCRPRCEADTRLDEPLRLAATPSQPSKPTQKAMYGVVGGACAQGLNRASFSGGTLAPPRSGPCDDHQPRARRASVSPRPSPSVLASSAPDPSAPASPLPTLFTPPTLAAADGAAVAPRRLRTEANGDGTLAALAAAGAAPGASGPHRPAGREALHEALILLTTRYYVERGLPIKKG